MIVIKKELISEANIHNHLDKISGEHKQQMKRFARTALLRALDIYDKNVVKGREIETEERKTIIDQWYRDLLDLKDEAFINIPSEVKRHL